MLRTERLELVPLSADDVDELWALLREPSVRRYLLDDQVVERDWVEGVVAQSARDFTERHLGVWAARLREGGELVGITGFRDFHSPPVFELFYALGTKYWGRGLATEMARAALLEGLGRGGLARVFATADVPNGASIRVLERLGMQLERRWTGQQHDQVTYSLDAGDSLSD